MESKLCCTVPCNCKWSAHVIGDLARFVASATGNTTGHSPRELPASKLIVFFVPHRKPCSWAFYILLVLCSPYCIILENWLLWCTSIISGFGNMNRAIATRKAMLDWSVRVHSFKIFKRQVSVTRLLYTELIIVDFYTSKLCYVLWESFETRVLSAEEGALGLLRGDAQLRPAVGRQDRAQRVGQRAHDLSAAARLRVHAARNGAQPDAEHSQAVRAVRLRAFEQHIDSIDNRHRTRALPLLLINSQSTNCNGCEHYPFGMVEGQRRNITKENNAHKPQIRLEKAKFQNISIELNCQTLCAVYER